MFQCEGIMLPDGEMHLVAQLRDKRKNPTVDGRGSYQKRKRDRALSYAAGRRVAVDVGAHVGLWSMDLVKRFERVIAFEPVRAHRACFERNVPDRDRVKLYACALGREAGTAGLSNDPLSSGDTHLQGAGETPVCAFDDLLPEIDRVDFVKLDCEGYELFALHGMRRMLERCRPAVIVEQKPGKAQKYGVLETAAVDVLTAMGAELRVAMSGDYILSWPC